LITHRAKPTLIKAFKREVSRGVKMGQILTPPLTPQNFMENCIFSNPVLFNGEPPATSTDFFQFSQMTCSNTEETLIQNTSTGAEFYFKNSITSGEVLVLVFLLLFAIFGITKIIADFFIPHRVTKF